MLSVEKISKSYGGRSLFENLSFQLTPGERCSLIGRNGSGKSTLLRILVGQETPDLGTVNIPKNYRLGFLEQHLSFTESTVGKEASLALPPEERDTPYRAEAILSGLGFKKEDLTLPPQSFSGGFQLRIQLAKTLVQEPDCLLLDEPTNYLDIVSVRWLENFLRHWRKEIVLISHDRAFLDKISSHTMGIHRGKLYKVEGGSKSFYDYTLQIEEVHEKTRLKIETQKEAAEDYIRRFGSKATKAKQAQSRKKAIERLPSLEKLAKLDGLNFHFTALPFPGKRLLHAENVSFHYEKTKPLIKEISFEIEPGERIAIIGKNGRGKSTLLKLLAGELSPSKGKISYAENLKMGVFGQTNIQKLNPALTVEEEIHLANINLPFGEVRKICGAMMFSGKDAEKKVKILSGGEKSRVLLGKILATPCNFLLLDEPTNHLDIESVEALLEALENFSGSVLIVCHDEEILERVADKLIICRKGGQEIFQGGYPYFLEKNGWEEAEEKKGKLSKSHAKEVKKKKAEIIQERSRVLSPLKKPIEELEKKINRIEQSIVELQSHLHTSIEKSDNNRISHFSKKLGEAKKQSDYFYLELEALYENLEANTRPFDQMLKELEG